MKLKGRVSQIYKCIKVSTRRFLIIIGIDILLVVFLIYLNESIFELSGDKLDEIGRINIVIGLGIIFSLCIGLLKERLVKFKLVCKFLG